MKRRLPTSSRSGLLSIGRDTRIHLMLGLLLLIAAAGVVGLIHVGQIRFAIAGVILGIIMSLSMLDVRLTVLVTFCYLPFIGDLRRILIPIGGWSGNDPLLLIGPAVAILLMAGALTSRRLALDSTVAKLVAVFMAFMTLQIFNPKQGPLMVGVAGAMLYLVPMLWFWVARAFATRDMVHLILYRLLPVIASIAAAMGLFQVFFGWLPYQLAWFRIAGYSALGPSEDLLRSISIFPNLTEYITYLAITIVVLVAALFKNESKWWLLVPLLFAAVFLAGSRGPIVFIFLTVTILFAIQGETFRSWVPRLAFTLILGVAALAFGLTKADRVSATMAGDGSTSRVGMVMGRQADLLPSDSRGSSTVGIHGNLFWLGIKWGLQEPLGRGIGSTTLAASKYRVSNDVRAGSTEKDITDMFVGGGVVGGVLYLLIIITVASTAVRFWMDERSMIALALLALLAVSGLGWLKPGQYAVTPLIWFMIGALDRITTDRRREMSTASPENAQLNAG
jgi:hypothetical protein